MDPFGGADVALGQSKAPISKKNAGFAERCGLRHRDVDAMHATHDGPSGDVFLKTVLRLEGDGGDGRCVGPHDVDDDGRKWKRH